MELPVVWEATETQQPKYSDRNTVTKNSYQNTATKIQQPKHSNLNTATEMQISRCTNYQFQFYYSEYA